MNAMVTVTLNAWLFYVGGTVLIACFIGMGVMGYLIGTDLEDHKADVAEELDTLREVVEKHGATIDHLVTALTMPVARPKPVPAKRVVEPKTDPLIPVQTGGPATVPTTAAIDTGHAELIEIDGKKFERRAVGGYSFNFKPQP